MRALYTNFLLLQVKGQRVGTLQSTSQVCESLFFLNQRGERKNIKSKVVKKEERKEKKKIKGKEPPVDSL